MLARASVPALNISKCWFVMQVFVSDTHTFHSGKEQFMTLAGRIQKSKNFCIKPGIKSSMDMHSVVLEAVKTKVSSPQGLKYAMSCIITSH